MSKKKLVQIERYLIIAILFLLCIALALGILVKYQNSQNTSSSVEVLREQNLTSKEQNEPNIFKENEWIENNQSILEQKMQEALSLNEQNLSLAEQNLTFMEENLSKKQNVIFAEENLTKEQSSNPQENVGAIKTSKPKLAIIIDDIANASQVRGLKALNLKLNPSFFPSDKNHSQTPKLASQFDFYMVHLPLAALNYNKPELDTLNPSDSKEKILKKIKEIKKDFKDLKFINNHTGSLFTSNEEAMRKLYEVLKSQNIFFVDSKTIGNSKASKVAGELNMPYIQRDIFLDNEDELAYIKKQIQSAVKLAQKKGFAIAIAHPKKNTFKALEQSKDLLQGVELVYLSEIYGK
ncbi:divergent polysaccharide deacetylase family protein [Campylobacter sp. VTCC 70190]|uniref:divergent polysaccharide deacetylase family protein n=1 Tax=Campylobacter sp. VTCC 70190 TaxID=3392118 RepID=UPI00398F4CCC